MKYKQVCRSTFLKGLVKRNWIQPLFSNAVAWYMAKLKTNPVCQRKQYSSTKLLRVHLQYVCNISARYWKILWNLGKEFHSITRYLISVTVRIWEMLKAGQFVKNLFMQIFNMSVRFLQSIEKINMRNLGGVNLTNYALANFIQYVQRSGIG